MKAAFVAILEFSRSLFCKSLESILQIRGVAPDFSPGERAFKPAENDPVSKMRALALVAAPPHSIPRVPYLTETGTEPVCFFAVPRMPNRLRTGVVSIVVTRAMTTSMVKSVGVKAPTV
jgi:hypothetical protein